MHSLLLAMASFTATPVTLPAVLAKVIGGDEIRLQPGDYGYVRIVNREFAPRVAIEAGSARLKLSLERVTGVTVNGGYYSDAVMPGPGGYGINVANSRQISLTRLRMSNNSHGIVVGRSQDIYIRGVTMKGMRTDGINLASVQRVTIQDVACDDNQPGATTHPDCVQMWSRPGEITSDVLLERAKATGRTQGFTAFNHVRNGVDDGGFDRIRFRKLDVIGAFAQGIALYDCRNCEITDSSTSTILGSTSRTSINIVRSTGVFERNTVGGKR